MKSKGQIHTATRLEKSGKDGYPGMDECELLAEFVGGEVLFRQERVDENLDIHYGVTRGPRLLHIEHIIEKDATGKEFDHFQLIQSWIKEMEHPPYMHTMLEDKSMQLEGQTHETLEKRKLLPGAADHVETFKKLKQSSKKCISKMSHHKRLPPAEETTIVGSVTSNFNMLKASNPTWSDYLLRLAVAALSIYQMKPSQSAITDHLKLLWIFLGGHFLKSVDAPSSSEMQNSC